MINLLIFITSPLYNNAKMEVPTNLIESDLQELLQAFKQLGHNPLNQMKWVLSFGYCKVSLKCIETNSCITLIDETQKFKAGSMGRLYIELYQKVFCE